MRNCRSMLSLATILCVVPIASCRREEPPTIQELQVDPQSVPASGEANVSVNASGSGTLQFKWTAARGQVEPADQPGAVYKAPGEPGKDTITVQVSNSGGSVTKGVTIEVAAEGAGGAVALAIPQDGDTVECEVFAKGTYSPEVQDVIWPVVFVGGRYHPQDEGGLAPSKANGQWLGTVRFGDCTHPDTDIGRTFQLVIVTADTQANAAFEAYLRTAAPNFRGLPGLPPGVTEHARIVVTRR